MKKLSFLFWIMLFLTSSCYPKGHSSYYWNNPISIPNADIIFDTKTEPEIDELFGKEILGFYSFKDQSITKMELSSKNPIQPYFLSNISIIWMNKRGNFGGVHEGQTYLEISTNKHNLDCYELGGIAYPQNGKVVSFNDNGLEIINPEDCSIEKTILTRDELTSLVGKYQIGPDSLSQNKDFLILEANNYLVKISLPNKEIFEYQKEGKAPAISPDQKMIAYVAPDGIHIMDVSGQNDMLIVPYIAWREYLEIFPQPSWAPDSMKIAYNKCNLSNDSSCLELKNYDIFVYDFAAKKESLIIHGGLNPSWNYFKQP